MKIDRKRFFDGYRATFGPLKQSQVDGLEMILGFMERDSHLSDIRYVAYMLATVKHECDESWQPVEERGKGRGRPYGEAHLIQEGDGVRKCVYYGRGYVQLTWSTNYARIGKQLGIPLLVHPEMALQPEIAYEIMSRGMREGLFTGMRLSDYISAQRCDYLNARRIINGLDRAGEIAAYARKFEAILRNATGESNAE